MVTEKHLERMNDLAGSHETPWETTDPLEQAEEDLVVFQGKVVPPEEAEQPTPQEADDLPEEVEQPMLFQVNLTPEGEIPLEPDQFQRWYGGTKPAPSTGLPPNGSACSTYIFSFWWISIRKPVKQGVSIARSSLGYLETRLR